MADTLKRIVGPANIASGTSTVFTGTTAHIYTFKSIKVINTTAAAITVLLGINGVAAVNEILPTVSIDAGGWAEYDGLTILSGTETLQAVTSATGLTITVSGLDQG